MRLQYNPHLKEYARNLQKNMTDSEKILWSKIRGKQIHGRQFYRQKNIGNYIVDFYCPSAKMIIELDWGQHYMDDVVQKDNKRDAFLRGLGFRVLRFTDIDVCKNREGVLETIFKYLE